MGDFLSSSAKFLYSILDTRNTRSPDVKAPRLTDRDFDIMRIVRVFLVGVRESRGSKEWALTQDRKWAIRRDRGDPTLTKSKATKPLELGIGEIGTLETKTKTCLLC